MGVFAAGAVPVIFSANMDCSTEEMNTKKTLYVGLDVHKNTIAVAVAEDGRGGEVRFHGTIVHSGDAVLRPTKTLTKPGNIPSFCYEAGPCGYRLHRLLTKLGFECAVVAPSMIPRKTGDRIRTDRRDVIMRELIRTRKQAKDAVKVAKQQLLSFLLRHGLK